MPFRFVTLDDSKKITLSEGAFSPASVHHSYFSPNMSSHDDLHYSLEPEKHTPLNKKKREKNTTQMLHGTGIFKITYIYHKKIHHPWISKYTVRPMEHMSHTNPLTGSVRRGKHHENIHRVPGFPRVFRKQNPKKNKKHQST